ncbi:MAG: hypothetical protein V1720_02340 [bacterium]
MMLFKSKKIILFLITVMTCSLFYSCVDEPVIEHVKMPYTAYQMVNLLNNVDNAIVDIIDHRDTLVAVQSGISLAKGARIPYKDINSGDWIFKIKDASGTTIFNSKLGQKLSSYEDAIVLLYGNYDPNPDVTTVSSIYLFNGMTYLNDYFPPADSSIVAFVNASYTDGVDDPTGISKVALENTATPGVVDTVFFDADIPSGEYLRANVKSGNYNIQFIHTTDGTQTEIASGVVDIVAGKLSYVVLNGAFGQETLSSFNETPTNARPK